MKGSKLMLHKFGIECNYIILALLRKVLLYKSATQQTMIAVIQLGSKFIYSLKPVRKYKLNIHAILSIKLTNLRNNSFVIFTAPNPAT